MTQPDGILQRIASLKQRVDALQKGAASPEQVEALLRELVEELVNALEELSSGEEERQQADEVLKRSEAKSRAFLETAPIGMVIVNEAGEIVSLNESLGRMFGYRRDELINRPIELLLPEHFRNGHRQHRFAYFQAPRPRPMGIGLELAGRRADGSEFPLEISLSSVETDEGLRAIAFVTDITLRRQAETRLRLEFAVTRVLAEEATLRSATPRLLQALCEGLGWELGELWRVDTEANVLRWEGLWHVPDLNASEFERRSREITFSQGSGLPGQVWASGQPIWMHDFTSPDLLTHVPRRSPVAEEIGLHAAFAFPVRCRERVIGVMAFFSRETREPDETLLEMMADIGTRIGLYIKEKQTQEEVQRQREMLLRSEKLAALGTLTAGLAHELNNPLGIMSSRIEIMLLEAAQLLPPQTVEDLNVLQRHMQRVVRLANALRTFARQSPREYVPLDMNAVVQETLLLVKKSFAVDGIEVSATLDPDLPRIKGDFNTLQQVLLNLLTNAREAMAGGGRVQIESRSKSGFVHITVADTGPGIPPEALARIFDPFYTTKANGTGLGLSVSYGIIQDHQGSLDVVSEPGKGTTFSLSFPVMD